MPTTERKLESREGPPITLGRIVSRARRLFEGAKFTSPNQEIQQGMLNLSVKTSHDSEAVLTAALNGFPVAILIERPEDESLPQEKPRYEVWIGGIYDGVYMHLGARRYSPTIEQPDGVTQILAVAHADSEIIDERNVSRYSWKLDDFFKKYGLGGNESILARQFGIS